MTIKKYKKICLLIGIVIIILLFPFSYHLRDGGTVIYEPITQIYIIYKMHALTAGPDRLYGDFYIGTVIYIFDQEVYNDVSVANRE